MLSSQICFYDLLKMCNLHHIDLWIFEKNSSDVAFYSSVAMIDEVRYCEQIEHRLLKKIKEIRKIQE